MVTTKCSINFYRAPESIWLNIKLVLNIRDGVRKKIPTPSWFAQPYIHVLSSLNIFYCLALIIAYQY